jgi:hypothetical protein
MADTKLVDEVVANSPEALREQALRRVKKRRDFHTQVFTCVMVNVAVWGIWAFIGVTSGTWNPWPAWITLGWGLAVTLNAWDVYLRRPRTARPRRQDLPACILGRRSCVKS